jgi:hypothetical protein
MTNINHLLTKLRDAGDRADYKPDLYDEAADAIERVRTVAVKRRLWKEAPCCVCGYNGPNYFQPSVHKCAAIEEKE